MHLSEIIGVTLVVCVIFLLFNMPTGESFKSIKSELLSGVRFKDQNKHAPNKPMYTADKTAVSSFTGHLDDAGPVGNLNDIETKHARNAPLESGFKFDNRWLPELDVQIDQHAATPADIDAGNLQFGTGIEYQQTRWADIGDRPKSYGISGDTYGKIVFGDDAEHKVPDMFGESVDAGLVYHGEYGRGQITI
jgi:hypothetical protein